MKDSSGCHWYGCCSERVSRKRSGTRHQNVPTENNRGEKKKKKQNKKTIEAASRCVSPSEAIYGDGRTRAAVWEHNLLFSGNTFFFKRVEIPLTKRVHTWRGGTKKKKNKLTHLRNATYSAPFFFPFVTPRVQEEEEESLPLLSFVG